ncbi:hypothetical protein niasHS_013738 [Heterodera schachtii]|uniref:FLYWCH-type domain-containing protein n=1 Tax=Heterodera schachtii TaxID=97005 RepID=A0ABD2IKA0_HETSC
MNANNNNKSLKNGGRYGATANANNKKAMPHGTPPKFVYSPGRAGNRRFCLKFVLQIDSDAGLEQYRKDNALLKKPLKDGRIYFRCSRKGCPYKMTAIKNEHQQWNVYKKKVHNHVKIIPIGQHDAERRKQKAAAAASGSIAGKLSAEKRRQNAAAAKEIETMPTTNYCCSSSAAAGGAKIQIQISAEPTPTPPPAAKLFELAKCEQEMRQIATKWSLNFSEKRGSYLFLPPKDTKAFKDGVLLSLTDRGDHIRMDEFHSARSQVDKIQRWSKARGHTVIMRLASDQCAKMFANSS